MGMEPNEIVIHGRPVGPGHPPFVIAEMSGNHNQSFERAQKIIDLAAACGADAIKLQTYTADSMTLDIDKPEFAINDPGSLWHGERLYELYQRACTPLAWHRPLFGYAREKGLIIFSTPFDPSAVDFLESLDAPCYKIASFENTDLPLIRKAASTGKPIILSTGMATAAEIDEAVKTARDAGCRHVILLKCTSTYPSLPFDSNLLTIPHMKDLFHCQIGISDHTQGTGASIAAVALGATVIEKHFTVSRAEGGVDAEFSLEPDEMQLLVNESERAWQSLGNIHYGPTKNEQPSLGFRRSLYIVKDIKAGGKLSADNLKIIRPGYGLPPKYIDILLGKRVSRNIKAGTPAAWDILG